MINQLFSKDKRLLTAEDFKRVFDFTDKKNSKKTVLFLARKNNSELPRLGLVVGKKNVKLAVQRNRIKRQIRETFRLNAHLIKDYDIVVIARKGLNETHNNELKKILDECWKSFSY